MAKHDRVTEADLPRLMEVLENGDAEAKEQSLRLLCPCRNPVYEGELWAAMIRAADTSEEEAVADRADHAIETLLEKARTNPEAQAVVRWLAERGISAEPREKRRRKRREKVSAGDMPRLLDSLDGDDAEAKHEALRLLCPCRNRRYDREAWLRILRVMEAEDGGEEKDDAGHAMGTLLERARSDPRSQELLAWLSTQSRNGLSLEQRIPLWNPRPRWINNLAIPPRPEVRRSRANRRRR